MYKLGSSKILYIKCINKGIATKGAFLCKNSMALSMLFGE